MSRTKKVWLGIGIVALAVLAVVWWLNQVGSSELKRSEGLPLSAPAVEVSLMGFAPPIAVPTPSPTEQPTPSPTEQPPVVATEQPPAVLPAAQPDPRNTIATQTLTISRAKVGANCWQATWGSIYRNRDGTFLFSWNQTAAWCANAARTKITSFNFQPWAAFGGQIWNLWSCRACPSGIVVGGNTTYRYQRANAAFQLCIPGIPVCQAKSVWVSTTIRANGTDTGDYG